MKTPSPYACIDYKVINVYKLYCRLSRDEKTNCFNCIYTKCYFIYRYVTVKIGLTF